MAFNVNEVGLHSLDKKNSIACGVMCEKPLKVSCKLILKKVSRQLRPSVVCSSDVTAIEKWHKSGRVHFVSRFAPAAVQKMERLPDYCTTMPYCSMSCMMILQKNILVNEKSVWVKRENKVTCRSIIELNARICQGSHVGC